MEPFNRKQSKPAAAAKGTQHWGMTVQEPRMGVPKPIDPEAESRAAIFASALLNSAATGELDVLKNAMKGFKKPGLIGIFSVNARDSHGMTALMHAAKGGHTRAIDMLLSVQGIDVNAQDNNGMTALMHASAVGSRSTIDMLLAFEGIDVNARDNEGDTALAYAIKNERPSLARFLRAVGVDD